MFRPEVIKALIEDPALLWAFAQVEKDNLEAAIYAKSDTERAELLAEVRAMRSAKGKLLRVSKATPQGDTGA